MEGHHCAIAEQSRLIIKHSHHKSMILLKKYFLFQISLRIKSLRFNLSETASVYRATDISISSVCSYN